MKNGQFAPSLFFKRKAPAVKAEALYINPNLSPHQKNYLRDMVRDRFG